MSSLLKLIRPAVLIGIAGTTALVAPTMASARPFDAPATAILCESGVSAVQSIIHADNEAVPAGSVFYAINEQGGEGATAAWFNTATMQFGMVPLVPTQLFPSSPAKAPIGVAETGAGQVISAVYGFYENAAGENCFVLPGVTTDTVAAPEPAATT